MFGKRERKIFNQIRPLKIHFRASRFLEILKHTFCIKSDPEITFIFQLAQSKLCSRIFERFYSAFFFYIVANKYLKEEISDLE